MQIFAAGDGRVKVIEWSIRNPNQERVLWLGAQDAWEVYRLILIRAFASEADCVYSEMAAQEQHQEAHK